MWRGDITHLEIDAIVNSAGPEELTNVGLVGAAIHRAAGERLIAECRTMEECEPGDAVITGGK